MKETDFRQKDELDFKRVAEFESNPQYREAVTLEVFSLIRSSLDAETASEAQVRSRLAKIQAVTKLLFSNKVEVEKNKKQETLDNAERKIR